MPSSAEARRAAARAWLAVGALLLLPSLAVFDHPTATRVLAWEHGTALSEPWRLWSAAWVHLSLLHLVANAAGTLLVTALGLAARLPRRAALAWALAWPLTHLGLLALPGIGRYGGLSGVLHAGVAIVAVALLKEEPLRARRLGLAIVVALGLKLLWEAPWRETITQPMGWDIAVAPGAHASGALAGVVLAGWLCRPWRQAGRMPR